MERVRSCSCQRRVDRQYYQRVAAVGGGTREGVLSGRGGSVERRSSSECEVGCDRVGLNVLAAHGTQLRRYVDSA